MVLTLGFGAVAYADGEFVELAQTYGGAGANISWATSKVQIHTFKNSDGNIVATLRLKKNKDLCIQLNNDDYDNLISIRWQKDGFYYLYVPKQGDSSSSYEIKNSLLLIGDGNHIDVTVLSMSEITNLKNSTTLTIALGSNNAGTQGTHTIPYGVINPVSETEDFYPASLKRFLTDKNEAGKEVAEHILFLTGAPGYEGAPLFDNWAMSIADPHDSYLGISDLITTSYGTAEEKQITLGSSTKYPIAKGSPLGNYLTSNQINSVSESVSGKNLAVITNKAILDSLAIMVTQNTIESQKADTTSSTGAAAELEAIKTDEANGSTANMWMFLINKYFVEEQFKPEGYSTTTAHTFTLSDGSKCLLNLKEYGRRWVKSEDGSGPWSEGGNSGQSYGGIYSNTKNQVTPEEDLRIRAYYTIMTQYYLIESTTLAFDSNKSDLDLRFSLKYRYANEEPNIDDDSLLGLYTPNKITIGDGSFIPTTTIAQAAVAKMSTSSTKISPSVVAANFSPIVDFLAYGVAADNNAYAIDESTSSTSDIPWSSQIDTIVPSIVYPTGGDALSSETTVRGIALDYTDYYLPALSSFGELTNNRQSVVNYTRIQAALKYIKRYSAVGKVADGSTAIVKKEATSMAGLTLVSTVGDEIDYNDLQSSHLTNLTIDSFLTEVGNGEAEEPGKEAGAYMNAYISITEGLQQLGLVDSDKSPTGDGERWMSPELERILAYYSDILRYKNSDTVTNPIDVTDGEATSVFKMFFGDNYDGFTEYYLKGVAASATHVPLVTSTYEVVSMSLITDTSFIEDFHYKYGFNRKALFIDSKTDAASRAYINGQKDVSRVATLRDFLNADQDIVLYVDPNMYNVRQVAEAQNLAYNKIQNTEDADAEVTGLTQSVADSWAEWRGYSAEAICKTGESKVYSQKLINSGKIAEYGVKKSNWFNYDHRYNHYILSDDSITEYLYETDDYSPNIGFAVVSGLYKDRKAFNIAYNQSIKMSPVFVSSPDLWNLVGVTSEQYNSLYNYMLASNIKRKLGVDPDLEDDLDSPLFLDIYGNICTQSGIVVIPAAANASLYKSSSPYNVATAAMAELYGDYNADRVKPTNSTNTANYLNTDAFSVDEDGCIAVGNPVINGVSMDFSNLNISSAAVKNKLYTASKEYAAEAMGSPTEDKYNFRFNMIIEVMRGAPIENINYTEEGLLGTRNMDKTGIYIAYRVEQLTNILNANSNGNSLLSIPNIAFLPYIEYIIIFLFDILFAIGIFILMFRLYADGVGGTLGWKTIIDFMITILSIVFAVIAVPSILNFSYYQTNKALLQDESFYIQMVNYEKRLLGTEVGVRENVTPASTTQLYLKLDQVSIPYWNLATDVFAENKFASMSEIYDTALSSSVYYFFNGVERKNSSLYMNIDYLYDSTAIQFATPDDVVKRGGSTTSTDGSGYTGYIYQNRLLDDQEMSYVIPYYAIIDSLLYDINVYNEVNESSPYRIKNNRYGISTMGLCKSYLLSNNFIGENEDKLGLYEIYGLDRGIYRSFFKDTEIQAMRNSYWCNWEALEDGEIKEKLALLDKRVVNFVVENRTMLDKVSDETFIKTVALYASVQHNDIFSIPSCCSLEVIELDMNDLLRLAIAPRSIVTANISLSYANFAYQVGGIYTIMMITFIAILVWFTSVLKPAIMIAFLVLLIISFVIKKLVRLENNSSLQGYIISMSIMCLVNILYALMLKLMMLGPAMGMNSFSCTILIVVVQIVYVVILTTLFSVVLKNPSDIGMYSYKAFYNKHMSNRITADSAKIKDMTVGRFNHQGERKSRRYKYSNNVSTRGLTGDDIIQEMRDSDRYRREQSYEKK